eukprot:4703731-Prymnesium_polylepis.1
MPSSSQMYGALVPWRSCTPGQFIMLSLARYLPARVQDRFKMAISSLDSLQRNACAAARPQTTISFRSMRPCEE